MASWIYIAFALVLHAKHTSATFRGDGTTYGPPAGQNPQGGNCNLMNWLDIAPKYHVALNEPQYGRGAHCGRCVEVQCVDTRCTSNEKVIAQITDRCPECKEGDLDMSLPLFNKVTGFSTDRLKIMWSFVDCPVRGGIQVCAKDGSNPYWLSVQACNTVNGVTSMKIMESKADFMPGAYYFLSKASNNPLEAIKIEMTSATGETINAAVSLVPGQCTVINQQFTKSSTSNNSPPGTSPQPVAISTTLAPNAIRRPETTAEAARISASPVLVIPPDTTAQRTNEVIPETIDSDSEFSQSDPATNATNQSKDNNHETNISGIVMYTIIGIAAVVCVVLGVIALQRHRKIQQDKWSDRLSLSSIHMLETGTHDDIAVL